MHYPRKLHHPLEISIKNVRRYFFFRALVKFVREICHTILTITNILIKIIYFLEIFTKPRSYSYTNGDRYPPVF